jgi:hypothetical protein
MLLFLVCFFVGLGFCGYREGLLLCRRKELGSSLLFAVASNSRQHRFVCLASRILPIRALDMTTCAYMYF